jgi:hypothetical protein
MHFRSQTKISRIFSILFYFFIFEQLRCGIAIRCLELVWIVNCVTYANLLALRLEGRDFLFLAAEMDEEEREQFFIFISFSLQWIERREDCHLDSAGFKGRDENSQSTFTSCRVAVVFTRRAVSRISGFWREIHHLVSWGKQENGTDKERVIFNCNTI